MKEFFEYCYYRLNVFYVKSGEKYVPDLSAYLLLCCIQWFNLFTLYIFIKSFVTPLAKLNFELSMGLFIIICLNNHFVLRKNRVKIMHDWEANTTSKYKGKGWLIIVYMIVSILLLVASMKVSRYQKLKHEGAVKSATYKAVQGI
jgi:hypothetical protein